MSASSTSQSLPTSYSEFRARAPWDDPFNRKNQVGFLTITIPTIHELAEDDFHVISPAVKDVIFKTHLPKYAAQITQGVRILSKLTRLAPDVAAGFHLKPNLIDQVTFRLWSQREHPAMREDSYVALSYRWRADGTSGSPDAKYPLPIPSVMFGAVAAQRGWRTTGVWIDQLCIDQENEEEKGNSIAAMDAIYRCAKSVVVTLTDVWITRRQRAFLQEYISDFESDEHGTYMPPHAGETPPYFHTQPILRELFVSILSSEWFQRAWCGHEMQCAEHVVFCAPCQPLLKGLPVTEVLQFSGTFFWHLLMLSAEVPGGKIHSLGPTGMIDRLMTVFHPFERVLAMKRQMDKSDPEKSRSDDNSILSYPTTCREIFELQTGGRPDLPPPLRTISATLDKISISLNVLETGLAVVRDLEIGLTEDKALYRLMILGLAAGDPTVLCTVGPGFDFSGEVKRPSWLCRPAYADLGSGALRKDRLPPILDEHLDRISLDPSPERRWVQLDFVVSPPPVPAKLESYELAKLIIQRAKQEGMGRPPDNPIISQAIDPSSYGNEHLNAFMDLLVMMSSGWGAGRNYDYWQTAIVIGTQRECFTWTLACILDCGWKWALNTAKRCGYPNPTYLESRLEGAPEQVSPSHLASMSWAMSQMGRDAVQALLCIAMWMYSWNLMTRGSDGTQGTHTAFMPAIVQFGVQKGKAVIFMPTDALTQLAIPRALMNEHYSRLPCVWLLNARDDPLYERMQRGLGAEWFLRGKSILLTDVSVENADIKTGSARQANGAWVIRDQVRVHGCPPPKRPGEPENKSAEDVDSDLARLRRALFSSKLE